MIIDWTYILCTVIDTEDYGVGSEASQKTYECKVKVWDSKKT